MLRFSAGISDAQEPANPTVQHLDVQSIAGRRDVLRHGFTRRHNEAGVRYVRLGKPGVQDLVARSLVMAEKIKVFTVDIEGGNVVVDIADFLPGDGLASEAIERHNVRGQLILHSVGNDTHGVRGAVWG